MKLIRSRIFSLILLMLIVSPVAIIFCILKTQQKQVRKEVKWKLIASVDKSELVELKFHQKDIQEKLKWKHAKEFKYRGEFYDIVEQTTENDSVTYWCWWDHEETALSRKLDHLLALDLKSNTKHQQQKQSLQKLFKSLHFENKAPLNNSLLEQKAGKIETYHLVNAKNIWISISSPPPQVS